jgi:hypothetical protein
MNRCWALTGLGLLLATKAIAQEAAPPPAHAPVENHWAVGLGVGYATLPTQTTELGALITLLPGAGPSGGVAAEILNQLPSLTANGEWRMAPATWLSLGVGASTSKYSQGSGDAAVSAGVTYAGLGVGLRQVFNPGSPVEVSVWGALGGGYASVNASSGATPPLGTGTGSGSGTSDTVYSISVGLKAGAAFEHALTDHLSLRLVTALAQASYVTVGESQTPSSGAPSSSSPPSGFSAALTVQPTLELNLLF